MTRLLTCLCTILLLMTGCSAEQQESAAEQKQSEPTIAVPLADNRQESEAFRSISAQTAQKLIADKENLLVLDTRTTREIISNGTIPGAQQASLRAIFQNELDIARDRPILVLCAVGGRSYAAGKIMVRNGFQEIYNLQGGLRQWKAMKLPVIYPGKSP